MLTDPNLTGVELPSVDLLQKFDVPAPRYTSYPTADRFNKNFTAADYEEALKTRSEDKPLSLYVHIPFCVRKCAYCDFLSAPAGAEERAAYVDALVREIRSQKGNFREYRVTTVFLGGGTPSILEGEDTARIFDALFDSFDIRGDAEITLEANPGTVTEEKAASWKKSGVNRLSIGLQSADNRELEMLGRIHTFEDFLDTWESVRRAGFDNVNIDLISAIPGQTEESWEKG